MARTGEKLRSVLAESDLFETLDEASLDRLLAITRERDVSAGEVIFTRGESARALYAVTGGQFKAVTTAEDGREIVLRLLDAGVVFGEIALLDGGPRTATVLADRASSLATIDRRDLLQLMRSSPDIALNLLAVLAARLRATTTFIEETNFMLLPTRLARRLLALADDYGQRDAEDRVKVRISQEELGQHVATSRVSVNQQLKAWESEGILKTSRGAVTLLDRAALVEAAKA